QLEPVAVVGLGHVGGQQRFGHFGRLGRRDRIAQPEQDADPEDAVEIDHRVDPAKSGSANSITSPGGSLSSSARNTTLKSAPRQNTVGSLRNLAVMLSIRSPRC